MASIVLLLSELLGGAGSAGMLAANCYVGGHSLQEFRAPAAAKGGLAPEGAKKGNAAVEEESPPLEDLAAVPRMAVDVMWP